MEINIKDTKPWLKEIEVTIEPERVKHKIEQITASYANKAQVPGFRKGKVPRPILQRRYGATFEAMAIDELFDEAFKEIIQNNNLQPVSQAQISDYTLTDDKTLKFELSFEVIPEFELKNYVGIKIKKQEPTGFDEEFDRRVRILQEKCATYISLNRPAENNDYILVDYEIYEQNKLVGKKQSGVMIELGSNNNHPNINQALLGVKPGDEKMVSVSFPEDFSDKTLANRTLEYKFYVRDIKEKKLPEIDDEFAKDLGFKDLSELKDQLNQEIMLDRARIIEDDLKSQIYHYLVSEHNFDPPNVYVEMAYKEIINEYQFQDSEETRKKLANHAQERARFTIILDKIAEKENIKPTEQDIEQELEKYRRLGINESQLAMIKTSPVFISRITHNRVMDWLLQKAEIITE